MSPAEVSWGSHERPSPAGVESFAPGGQSPRRLTHIGQEPALSKQGAVPLLRLPLTSTERKVLRGQAGGELSRRNRPPVSSGAAPEGSSSEPAARQLRANEVPKVRTPVPATGSMGSMQSWAEPSGRRVQTRRASHGGLRARGPAASPASPSAAGRGHGRCGVRRTHALRGLRGAVPERPRVPEPDRRQRARGRATSKGMSHARRTTRRPWSPVKRIPQKTFLPHHRRDRPGHQVRVILGAVAHEVAEPQLPGLSGQKHRWGRMTSLRQTCMRTP